MGQAIYHHLCAIQMPQAKDSALRVITLLARNHIPELVAAFLDFSSPLDRYLAVSSSLTPSSPRPGPQLLSPLCPSQPTGNPECFLWEGVSSSVHLSRLLVDIPHETSTPASTTQLWCSLIPECSCQDPDNQRASASISVAPSTWLCSSFSSSYSSERLLQPPQPSQVGLGFLPCHWSPGDRPGFSLLLPNTPPLDPTSAVRAIQHASTIPGLSHSSLLDRETPAQS